jgi:uncharacterized phage-associated protein
MQIGEMSQENGNEFWWIASGVDMSNISVHDIADWLLIRSGGMSHLKLQKMLFYCYGGLVGKGIPVDGEFEAWKYGPVCREVWLRFKCYEDKTIPPPSVALPQLP